MRQIINHFTDDDLYKFTMCVAVIDNFPRTMVKYTFVDRDDTIYPPGFADELKNQVKLLENVTVTDEEIGFMRKKCSYIPDWFYSYLKGFRYDSRCVHISQDAEGHLKVELEGSWSHTILFEVKILAIISELYYIMTGKDSKFNYQDYYQKAYHKATRLIKGECVFSDMGTRRRASFEAQETAVEAMRDCSCKLKGPGKFGGTSNVYFAMKYDLTPIGTMAHEFICAIAGMYGPLMANHLGMNAWAKTYRGALGTFLYDTYGWDIFSLNFSEDYANMFKGLRIDSGDNHEQLNLILNKYRSLKIDPKTKQIIFSNGLNTSEAIEIQQFAAHKCQPSFGIGTHFTNDFDGVKPMNIVIKLTAVKITESWPFYSSTCKLSEDKGKYTGDPQTVRRFLETLHLAEPAGK